MSLHVVRRPVGRCPITDGADLGRLQGDPQVVTAKSAGA